MLTTRSASTALVLVIALAAICRCSNKSTACGSSAGRSKSCGASIRPISQGRHAQLQRRSQTSASSSADARNSAAATARARRLSRLRTIRARSQPSALTLVRPAVASSRGRSSCRPTVPRTARSPVTTLESPVKRRWVSALAATSWSVDRIDPVTLQPFSVEGDTGINLAVGVSDMVLRPGSSKPPRSRTSCDQSVFKAWPLNRVIAAFASSLAGVISNTRW